MREMFKIYQIDSDEARNIIASENAPHHHDFEELIIGIEGNMEHFIDFKTTLLRAPFVSFVTRGKVHRVLPVMPEGKSRMWVLRFRSELISETVFLLYAWYHEHASFEFGEAACFSRLGVVCELLEQEMRQDEPDYAVVRQLLGSLFSMIEAERRRSTGSDQAQFSAHSETFKNFLQILEDNFRRNLGVDFYAEKLFMSSRNLNLIAQQFVHQSVSAIIENRKLLEAKNLLTTTEKSVSEIGFELGYQDKAYFTKVFKKRTGQTPTDFRSSMKQLVC